MTEQDCIKFDKLNEVQDTLLALASYDWFMFNDARIFGLISEYELKVKPAIVFEFYHGKNPAFYELNNMRYVNKHKAYLNTLIY